jgi:hypothetical protein
MRIAALALVSAAALILVGCTPAPHPTSSPKPTATPVFRTDAEALAAAEKAYRAYEAAVDESLTLGNDHGLSQVATAQALKASMESVSKFKSSGRHQVGKSIVEHVRPANLSSLLGPRPTEAQIYACLDVSAVLIVDAQGNDTSVSGRETVYPTLVTLQWKRSRLLVSKESVWDGANFCH